ncbi:hypothetical protein Tco_1029785 [Tanacetum coccineum]|uniref:Uncharacterized protein n=1 Tax=Tanacetum coccineum TaxID=301880 RepID=A0ABQ5G502_9ASTR
MQEFTDTFKEFLERLNIQRKEEEKLIFEEAARQEEEKRIAKEKEAAELEDSDSLMEEIDLFLASDDSMPPGIEDDDYDSEGDIHFLEELLSKPPDVEICFNFEPDTGDFINKVVGDISEHDVLMPNFLPTQPTICPVFDLFLSFSSKNEDKVFNLAILISPLLSHRGEFTSNFSKSPMMISGGDIPHLDVLFLHFYPLTASSVGGGIESGSRLGEQK